MRSFPVPPLPLPLRVPDLSSYRIGTQTAPTTDSGWATYSGGARLFLPAAVNYCTNPSFETDTNGDGLADGWIHAYNTATAATLTRPAALGRGTYSQRMQYTGVVADSGAIAHIYTDDAAMEGFTAGDIVTSSALLKGTLTGCTVRLFTLWWNAANVYVGYTESGDLSVTESIARFAYTHTAPATAEKMAVQIRVLGIDNGDSFDLTIDDVFPDKSAVLLPYFDGSYDNCDWSSTADASTSTRTVSALDVDAALGSTAFTIAGRFTPLWAANDGLAHNICTLYAGADARVTIYKHTDNKLYCTVTDGTDSASSATAALSFAKETTHTFVARCTWAGTVDLNLDGTDAAQGDASAVAAQTIDSIVFDGGPTGYVGPVAASATEKAAAWVTAVQAGSGAVFANPPLLWGKLATSDILIPLESDGYAWVKP